MPINNLYTLVPFISVPSSNDDQGSTTVPGSAEIIQQRLQSPNSAHWDPGGSSVELFKCMSIYSFIIWTLGIIILSVSFRTQGNNIYQMSNISYYIYTYYLYLYLLLLVFIILLLSGVWKCCCTQLLEYNLLTYTMDGTCSHPLDLTLDSPSPNKKKKTYTLKWYPGWC